MIVSPIYFKGPSALTEHLYRADINIEVDMGEHQDALEVAKKG